ncbi:MAG: hypothetical protein KJ043_15675 [Anaerolineae bacterium]|nr:hypothetical protein [Anaerolineae bacterium]
MKYFLDTVIQLPFKLLYRLLIDPTYRERIAYGSFGVDGYRLNKQRHWIPIFGGGLMARQHTNFIGAEGDGGGRITPLGEDDLLAGGGGGGFSMGISQKVGRFHITPYITIGGEGGGITQIRHEALRHPPIAKTDIHGASGGGGLMNGAGIQIDYRIGKQYGVLIGVKIGYRGVLVGGIRLPRPFIQAIVGFGKMDGVL